MYLYFGPTGNYALCFRVHSESQNQNGKFLNQYLYSRKSLFVTYTIKYQTQPMTHQMSHTHDPSNVVFVCILYPSSCLSEFLATLAYVRILLVT